MPYWDIVCAVDDCKCRHFEDREDAEKEEQRK
jgi:hypothetical protein